MAKVAFRFVAEAVDEYGAGPRAGPTSGNRSVWIRDDSNDNDDDKDSANEDENPKVVVQRCVGLADRARAAMIARVETKAREALERSTRIDTVPSGNQGKVLSDESDSVTERPITNGQKLLQRIVTLKVQRMRLDSS